MPQLTFPSATAGSTKRQHSRRPPPVDARRAERAAMADLAQQFGENTLDEPVAETIMRDVRLVRAPPRWSRGVAQVVVDSADGAILAPVLRRWIAFLPAGRKTARARRHAGYLVRKSRASLYDDICNHQLMLTCAIVVLPLHLRSTERGARGAARLGPLGPAVHLHVAGGAAEPEGARRGVPGVLCDLRDHVGRRGGGDGERPAAGRPAVVLPVGVPAGLLRLPHPARRRRLSRPEHLPPLRPRGHPQICRSRRRAPLGAPRCVSPAQRLHTKILSPTAKH